MQVWVQKNYSKIVNFGQSLGKPALALGKGAVSLLIALATIFVLVLLLLLEGPKLRTSLLGAMSAERRESVTSVASQVNGAVTGYMLGNFLTSLIAGLVVFLTLLLLGVPYPLLWALWVALVDFLPMIGGALAGIPTVLFAAGHSLTAGIVTLIVFLVYTQVENHILNPVIMSRTVRINPLLVLMSILIAASIGSWIGGLFGGFVAALLAIPAAGAVQVIVAEMWRATAPPGQAGAPVPEGAATIPDRGLRPRPSPPQPDLRTHPPPLGPRAHRPRALGWQGRWLQPMGWGTHPPRPIQEQTGPGPGHMHRQERPAAPPTADRGPPRQPGQPGLPRGAHLAIVVNWRTTTPLCRGGAHDDIWRRDHQGRSHEGSGCRRTLAKFIERMF